MIAWIDGLSYDHLDLAQRYRVLTVPTIAVVAANGRVAEINYGVTSEERLRQQLEKLTSDRL